jgi:hypothetical protein
MNRFLTVLAIGLPLAMLLGESSSEEERSEMAERMRQIWIDARQRARELSPTQVSVGA